MKKSIFKTKENFNIESFIDVLLKEIKMDKASPDVKNELRDEIKRTFSERVNAVVIDSMEEKDLLMLEKITADQPELDLIDVLSMITAYMPGLNDRILKVINDLYEELVDNARMIDEKLKN